MTCKYKYNNNVIKYVRKNIGVNPMNIKHTSKHMQAGLVLGLSFMLGVSLHLNILSNTYAQGPKATTESKKLASSTLPPALPLKATVIQINEKPVLSVESKEAAEKVLEEVKLKSIGEHINHLHILSQEFMETIEFKEVLHDLSPISTSEEALKILLDPIDEQGTYVVKEGDTFWTIAQAHDLTSEELQEMNAELDPELLQIGEKIFITTSHPLLHIKTLGTIKYQENIPFDTIEVEDSTLSVHSSKVLIPGEEGIKEVSAEVILENDKLINKNILEEKILKSPITQKVSKGTKPNSINDVSYLPRPAYGPITSGFGNRWGRMHNGIDIGVPVGSPVKAVFDGTVTFSGSNGAYGQLVIIQHTDGYSTYYAHNSKLRVSVGQSVTQGQVIASSGNTGRSTGPHVHFEIRKNGVPINPRKYVN